MSLGQMWDAWKDLGKRYGAVFGESWKERKGWDAKRYRADEAEFLQA